MNLLYTLGFFSSLFAFFGFSVLARLAKINPWQEPLSKIGSYPRFSPIFNVVLTLYSVSQAIFLIAVFFRLQVWQTRFGLLALGCFLLTVIAGILCSLISWRISKRLHTGIAAVGFLASFTGGILFSMFYLEVGYLILGAMFLLLVILVYVILIIGLIRFRLPAAIHEGAFFVGVMIADFLFMAPFLVV